MKLASFVGFGLAYSFTEENEKRMPDRSIVGVDLACSAFQHDEPGSDD
jgi:hypothetical protein